MHSMLQFCFTWCRLVVILRHWSSIGPSHANNTSKLKLPQRTSGDSWQFQFWQVSIDRQYNSTASLSSDNNCTRGSHNDFSPGNYANSLTNSSRSNLTLGLNSGPCVNFDPGCRSSANIDSRQWTKPNHGARLFIGSFDLSKNKLLF